jgi:uncharacterized protein with PQ loop repeat
MELVPWIGVCAAFLTSLSYLPQVQKAWPRGSTSDLSLNMLLALTIGLLLWIAYGAGPERLDHCCCQLRRRGAVRQRPHIQNP